MTNVRSASSILRAIVTSNCEQFRSEMLDKKLAAIGVEHAIAQCATFSLGLYDRSRYLGAHRMLAAVTGEIHRGHRFANVGRTAVDPVCPHQVSGHEMCLSMNRRGLIPSGKR